ncbi:uncharacterized protein LOC110942333 [Helianthus annuus]|uniref:uncharacterized protein LOC110942333 n=1 Tax=Helianthus annuus TaxID=4232 RepID=UPI000B903118|nr:uncharacterized protein LOC110942333 [Helianthus annuus]
MAHLHDISTWCIRGYGQHFDPYVEYVGEPTMFSIHIFHGGEFVVKPVLKYVKGKSNHIDYIDADEFSVIEFNTMFKMLHYPEDEVVYYHYRIPDKSLVEGIRALGTDRDVIDMCQYVGRIREIEVYVEHWVTKLDTYFLSPPKSTSNVVIEEIAEDAPSVGNVPVRARAKPRHCVRRLAIGWLDDSGQSGVNDVNESGVNDVNELGVNDLEGGINLGDDSVNDIEDGNDLGVNDLEGGINLGDDAVNDIEVQDTVNASAEDSEQNEQDNQNGKDIEQVDVQDTVNASAEDTDSSSLKFTDDEEDSDDPDYRMEHEPPNTDEDDDQREHEGEKVGKNNNDDGDELDYNVDKHNMIQELEVDMDTFRAAVEIEGNDQENQDDEDNQNDEEENAEETTEIDLEDFASADENDPPLKKGLKKMRKRRKGVRGGRGPFYVGQLFTNKEDLKQMVKKHALDSRRQLVIRRNDNRRFRVVCHGVNPDLQGMQPPEGQFGDFANMSGPSEKDGESSTGDGDVDVDVLNTSNPTSQPPKKRLKHQKKVRFPKPTCEWVLHVSRSRDEHPWCVKTFLDNHTCLTTRKVRLYIVSAVAREVESILASNPGIPLLALQDHLEKKNQIQLSLQKTFRAKVMALHRIEGDFKAQYSILREYCEELLRSNPGTTVKIDVERECNPASPTRQFRRIYICLGALKEGFKVNGRNILGLDGCFMKGPFPGQVLSAVGIDSNNGIYPVAYSIVEAETKSSWEWFLGNLGDDLGLDQQSYFTFISDRQKGLIPALAKIFPLAEHRFCLRHIHENMKPRWSGNLFKEMLWDAACATTKPQFNRKMNAIRLLDNDLFDWLSQIPPTSWARSHFTGRAKTDVLLNNMCESFNNQLVKGRDKPIITCLEFIREYLMKKIVVVHKVIAKSNGPLTPYATRVFDEIKADASQYSVMMAGRGRFQVTGGYADQCKVDVNERTCTCRKWQLTGMPCKHGVAAIWDMARNGMNVGVLESWVDKVYWLQTWKDVYMHTIEPISGREYWTPSQCPTTLIPPIHHTPVGRPKKKRKKSEVEISELMIDKKGKMTRQGVPKTCKKCGNVGHNKRSCKGQGATQAQSQTTSQPQGQTAGQGQSQTTNVGRGGRGGTGAKAGRGGRGGRGAKAGRGGRGGRGAKPSQTASQTADL